MFHFQVFRRAEAKTFPVDRKGIRVEDKEKRKGEKKESKKERKKIGYESAWLMHIRESKILYNLQKKLAQNLAKL